MREKLFVALDVEDRTQAEQLVTELGEDISCYKVGMELFYREGAPFVKWLKGQNKCVFLDLKLHDIPNTVAQGLSSLVALGADILNVHASGGYEMMATGAECMRETAEKIGFTCPKLIAVTVLTSMDEQAYLETGHAGSVEEQVVRLAKLTQRAGLDGVVASPREAEAIRRACGEKFLIMTPGVRPTWAVSNDQSRIATPQMALTNGATMLVVGRPITQAERPLDAARKILAEMEGAKV